MPTTKRVQAWKPIIYLYDVTFDADNNPLIHEFGKFKPETHDEELTFNIQFLEEPFIDVLAHSDIIQVVVDLPGVEKQDICIHATGTILTIEITSPHSHYLKKINLPTTIDPSRASSTYKNGVLTVKLPKVKLARTNPSQSTKRPPDSTNKRFRKNNDEE
jgi:HSP20 family protein